MSERDGEKERDSACVCVIDKESQRKIFCCKVFSGVLGSTGRPPLQELQVENLF